MLSISYIYLHFYMCVFSDIHFDFILVNLLEIASIHWFTHLYMQVATFIIEKIVLDDAGLGYICATADRFFAVGTALAGMVTSMDDKPSPRLLKHIIHCYLRITDTPRFVSSLSFCRIIFIFQTSKASDAISIYLLCNVPGAWRHCRLAFLPHLQMGHSTILLRWVVYCRYTFSLKITTTSIPKL